VEDEMHCEICGDKVYGSVCRECVRKVKVYDQLVEALQSLAIPPYSDSDLDSFVKMQNAVAAKALNDVSSIVGY